MERLSVSSMCYNANGLGTIANSWNSSPTTIAYDVANGAFINGVNSAAYYYNFNRTVYVQYPYLNNANYNTGNGLLKGVTVSVSYSCGMGLQETCYCILSSAIANNVH